MRGSLGSAKTIRISHPPAGSQSSYTRAMRLAGFVLAVVVPVARRTSPPPIAARPPHRGRLGRRSSASFWPSRRNGSGSTSPTTCPSSSASSLPTSWPRCRTAPCAASASTSRPTPPTSRPSPPWWPARRRCASTARDAGRGHRALHGAAPSPRREGAERTVSLSRTSGCCATERGSAWPPRRPKSRSDST